LEFTSRLASAIGGPLGRAFGNRSGAAWVGRLGPEPGWFSLSTFCCVCRADNQLSRHDLKPDLVGNGEATRAIRDHRGEPRRRRAAQDARSEKGSFTTHEHVQRNLKYVSVRPSVRGVYPSSVRGNTSLLAHVTLTHIHNTPTRNLTAGAVLLYEISNETNQQQHVQRSRRSHSSLPGAKRSRQKDNKKSDFGLDIDCREGFLWNVKSEGMGPAARCWRRRFDAGSTRPTSTAQNEPGLRESDEFDVTQLVRLRVTAHAHTGTADWSGPGVTH
jgi:hypothetical protein